MDSRIQEMLDHHEIRKALAAYCHACDRTDAKMMADAYNGADSFDDHGHVKAAGPEYAQVMTGLIVERTEAMSHILGQSLISVEGDRASSETFFLAFFRMPEKDSEPKRMNQLIGRFVDKWVRVDGSWKIAHRTCVRDTSITLGVTRDDYADYGFVQGTRDASDPGAALLKMAHHASKRESHYSDLASKSG
jgi:ketosteroid isomerase-like protein